jgi:hypothetical protein
MNVISARHRTVYRIGGGKGTDTRRYSLEPDRFVKHPRKVNATLQVRESRIRTGVVSYDLIQTPLAWPRSSPAAEHKPTLGHGAQHV